MRTISQACSIALAGILLGGFVSAKHPRLKLEPDPPVPFELPPTEPAPNNATTSPAQAPTQGGAANTTQQPKPQVLTGPDVTVAQALVLYNSGAPFIDARHREEFELGHVSGAFLLPPEAFGAGKPDAINFLAPDQPVVVYCGGGSCDASKNVVILLQQLGFSRCFIMNDGYPAWAGSGHPTATGKPDYEAGGG